eukprot:scaffold12959_cov116-Isochrysis_galbana.AAC.11
MLVQAPEVGTAIGHADDQRHSFMRTRIPRKTLRRAWPVSCVRTLRLEFIRHLPCTQVHHVGSLMQTHHFVRSAACKPQAKASRSEFDIEHRVARVLKFRRYSPASLAWLRHRVLSIGHLLPYAHFTIERAAGEHLTKLWMGPHNAPNGTRVRPPLGCLLTRLVKDAQHAIR